MSGFRYVRLKTAELEYVDHLDRRCFPDDEPVFVGGERLWWVAQYVGDYVHKDRIVGFAGVSPLREQGLAYLCRCGVLSDWRGRGIQRRLLRARIAWCRKQGLEPITDCTFENVHSINNLTAVGFKAYSPEYRWALPNSIYWRLPL